MKKKSLLTDFIDRKQENVNKCVKQKDGAVSIIAGVDKHNVGL